jgi:cytochrome P450
MSFRSDPLRFIETAFSDGRPATWLPGRQLCVADAEAGRRILWNREGLYRDTTDFFGTRNGPLQPREAQISVGAAARAALEARLQDVDIEGAVAELPARTAWPATGNRLLFDLLEPLLSAPRRGAEFRTLVREVVASRILRRRPPWWNLRAQTLRQRLIGAVRVELASGPGIEEGDLLDILAGAAPDNSVEQITDVYVSLLFAMVGSIGFAFGWAVWLMARNEAFEDEPAHLILEALRLYPVAWFLGRVPAVAHEIMAHPVTPDDVVVVCPYAIHRNPAWWDDPLAFRPDRWRDRRDRVAWLPFGAGPHSCVAVNLTLDLGGRLVAALQSRGRWSVQTADERPGVGPALRPPQFTLESPLHGPRS